MRSLIMFRHGKSDWDAGDGNDLARPLSSRGRRSARTMGRFLAHGGQLPDRALTSPALRAEETLRLAMDAGGWNCEVISSEALYGGPAELLDELRDQPVHVEVLLIVGHEPTWSETVEILIGGGRVRMPTGAMARVELDLDSWVELGPGKGELAWLVHPRLIAKRGRPGEVN